jgi:hypothetical protein
VNQGRDPWEGYINQKTILFDEWTDQQWTITEMNRFLDKWRLILQRRYHNVYAAWTRAVICCNCSPVSWYADERNTMLVDALRRRITGNCRYIEFREDQGGPSMDQLLSPEYPSEPFSTQLDD